jgi:hypothetical protein
LTKCKELTIIKKKRKKPNKKDIKKTGTSKKYKQKEDLLNPKGK